MLRASLRQQSHSTTYVFLLLGVLGLAACNGDGDQTTPGATPGVTVAPTAGLITGEDLTSSSFTVVLGSQPGGDVAIDVTSNDTTEGTVSPSPLTFTPANWAVPQTVTVTGVDDALSDGHVPYGIDFSVGSTDPDYDGLSVSPVSVTNQDNDPSVIVTPNTGLITSENLTSASFTVVLNTVPNGTVVTISLSSSNTTEGTVSPSFLTFTSANWDTTQTVTVTGVDDAIVDGTINYNVTFVVQSDQPDYNSLPVTPVSVTNQDND